MAKLSLKYAVCLMLILATTVQASGLGIPLDGFLASFTNFVIGVGFPVGLLGLLGWGAAHMNNTFGTMLGGSVNLFATAGMLGGGATIMGMLGLAAGGILP